MLTQSERDAIERVRDAAPDLLEALKALLADLEECGQLNAYDEEKGCGIGGAVDMAWAAIAKAEWKAPPHDSREG